MELELVSMLEEDCSEDVDDDAFVVEEEGGDAWAIVELEETVEAVEEVGPAGR